MITFRQRFDMTIIRSILPLDVERAIKPLIQEPNSFFLVGGALRDHLACREIHDYDFVLMSGVKAIARQIAKQLNADFYMMDETRQTARVIWKKRNEQRITLDFATMQGKSIRDDLAMRDFTIDAIAMDMAKPGQLIDPLGGQGDLERKLLKVCSPTSLVDDSIRAIRGARLAIQYGLAIEKKTKEDMMNAADRIRDNSPERIRDELFKIFNSPKAVAIIHLLIFLGLLDAIFPDLKKKLKEKRSRSLFQSKMDITLAILENLEVVSDLLCADDQPELGSNTNLRILREKLGRFHQSFKTHLDEEIIPGRSRRSLLNLAALFRFAGALDLFEEGLDHPGKININQPLMDQVEKLALSKDEAAILEKIATNQGRVHKIRISSPVDYPRLTYRFFIECGEVGVDLCLLALSDFLALGGFRIKPNEWLGEIETCRMLLEAWWEHRDERIYPPRIVTGEQIIQKMGVDAGPIIGEVLDAINEAHALGQISTQEDAMILARKIIDKR